MSFYFLIVKVLPSVEAVFRLGANVPQLHAGREFLLPTAYETLHFNLLLSCPRSKKPGLRVAAVSSSVVFRNLNFVFIQQTVRQQSKIMRLSLTSTKDPRSVFYSIVRQNLSLRIKPFSTAMPFFLSTNAQLSRIIICLTIPYRYSPKFLFSNEKRFSVPSIIYDFGLCHNLKNVKILSGALSYN